MEGNGVDRFLEVEQQVCFRGIGPIDEREDLAAPLGDGQSVACRG